MHRNGLQNRIGWAGIQPEKRANTTQVQSTAESRPKFENFLPTVDGITLRGRLRDGPLPINQALSCINGLLNALGHAHAMGILHRDIKPENIMLVDDDNAKLLDFGLAKSKIRERQNQVAETLITEPGAIVGTVGYMSPERLRGQELDERSDLFSVGAVMYEMLCQRPAFPGRNIAERMSAILATEPEPLSGSASISQVNMVLERALAKDRDLRYANAAAFLDDLSLLASGELQSTWPNTLVVSDFENVSGNPADDWIGTGVAESISAELVGVDSVQVIPREKWARQIATEHRSDRRAGIDYHKLGLSLGCRWLVCGGYQRMGNALRFTINLRQLLTDTNVITAKLDGTVDGIFNLQDQLAALIRTYYTDQTSQKLQLPKSVPAPARPQPSAYEFYIKGRQQWQLSGKADFGLAQSFFEKAIQRDPEYALAYAGLATVHALRFTYTTDSSLIDTTKMYAEKALALDSKLSEAHVWLGYAYLNDLDTQKAFAQQLMALQIDRKNLYGNYFAGVCLNASHSQSEATSLVYQMHVQDEVRQPHEWRFAQAVRFFQAALRIAPEHGWSYLGAAPHNWHLADSPSHRPVLKGQRNWIRDLVSRGWKGF